VVTQWQIFLGKFAENMNFSLPNFQDQKSEEKMIFSKNRKKL
jgi:hypothetical protein